MALANKNLRMQSKRADIFINVLLLLIVLAFLQKAEIAGIASAVFKTTDMHSSEFLPVGTAYLEAEKLRTSLAQQPSAK